MDYSKLDSHSILAINNAAKLFSGETLEAVKNQYRRLSSLWHPDKHPDNGTKVEEVFKHIKTLYEEAEKKIEEGSWAGASKVMFTTLDGKKFELSYLATYPFDLGQVYIANRFVIYCVEKQYQDLFDNAVKVITKLPFANAAMREQISRHLPKLHSSFETSDSLVMVIEKTADVLALKDVMTYYKGVVGTAHAAWIISGLYNLACYLEFAKLNHNDFSIDNIFISPQYHSVLILGGWWYTVGEKSKLLALSSKTLDVCPLNIVNSKTSSKILDLECIKATGRELLGDSTGVRLKTMKDIPATLSSWICLPSMGSAIKDYDTWQQKILIGSFGARRFTKMELTSSDIYS